MKTEKEIRKLFRQNNKELSQKLKEYYEENEEQWELLYWDQYNWHVGFYAALRWVLETNYKHKDVY